MNAIVPSEIQAKLDAAGISINIGDWFISNQHHIICVSGFDFDKNGKLLVQYSAGDYRGSVEINRFIPNNDGNVEYYKLNGTPEHALAEAIANLSAPAEEEPENTDTALALFSGVDRVKQAQIEMTKRQHHIKSMQLVIESKLRALQSTVYDMGKKLRYAARILELLETFAGVYEEVQLIRDGEPASVDTPVVIRQLILYCDEEVGDISTRNGVMGIDFQRVTDFDAWLIEDDHFRDIVPEEKGIVAFKPSRTERQYHEHWYTNMQMNNKNKATYLLIRNGERLYRVWTNMVMHDRLFPSLEEWEKLSAGVVERFGREYVDRESTKDKQLDWQQQAVLIQGLLMRTSILQPLPGEINLFDDDSYRLGWVIMLRDAEARLGDGHLPFKEWRKAINSQIKTGTRILYGGWGGWRDADFMKYHIKGNNYNTYPHAPNRGVYVVEELPQKDPYGNTIRFLYLPDDEVYTQEDGYKPRSKKVAFYLSAFDDDVLNYDQVSLADVDFYIRNRLERQGYHRKLPLLIEVRNARLAERAAEQPFITLIANEFTCDEQVVWDGLDWWKTRVKMYRALTSDDAKAWRMIRKYVRNTLQGLPLPYGD